MNRTNTVLAVLLVAVVVMTAVVGTDYSRPNLEILPDMKYTPAWEAFAANPNFANGQTMQQPVHGTIARGQMPLYYAATKEDAVRAGEELLNPYSLTGIDETARARFSASVERGGEVYRTLCVSCHGPNGAGDGLVTQRGFPPPPSMLTGKSLQMKDGQLFHILTYGQGSMAPLAAQLSRERRWDVINYVRDLQSKMPTPSDTPQEVARE
jgi:mono/diheme cytochrome c family protein